VSSASFMDFIYEMSGPQLFTFLPFRCEYDLEKHKELCEIYTKRVVGEANPAPKFWLAVDGAAYTSTGKDSKTGKYDWFENYMLAVEPMLRRRSSSMTYHGVGVSGDFLFGNHFRRFGAVALKVEPVALGLGRNWYLISTVRMYRHRFTADQFGAATAAPSGNGKREFVIGLNVEYRSPF
jgi:hypothetical protein